MSDANCAVRALRVVGLDLLNPELPFLTFLRKIVVLTFTFPALVVVIYQVARLLGLSSRASSTALIVSAISDFIMVSSSATAYVSAQYTNEVPGWAICVAMYGAAIGGLLNTFVSPLYPYFLMVAIFSIFACICEMPLRNLYLALIAVLFAVSGYNTCAGLTGSPLLMVAGGHSAQPLRTVLGYYLTALVALTIPVIACVLQTRQFRMLLAAAEMGNALSRDAAELLRNYDTDGVSLLLHEYSQSSDADPQLIESYTALVSNLNLYRPHLPNWMVRHHDDHSDSSRGDCGDGTPKSTRSLQSSKGKPSSTASDATHEIVTGSVDAYNVTAEPKSVTVAFSIVDFKVAGELGMTARGAAMSAFSDNVHRLAAATHCAVHGFVGDTVQLSWNATLRAVQPEVKAVRFLCGLKAALAGNTDVSVAAAAMHGKATTQFAGTGAVQAVAISLPWRSALRTLVVFAAKHRTFVVHHKTASAASHACALRGVEAVLSSTSHDPTALETILIHEVLGERHADDDGEWMYVLNKDGADKVSAALNACLAGEYGEAVSSLENVEESTNTVRNLKSRAEAALLNPSTAFVAQSCCHL
jgi:hypothetical protein